MTKTNVLLSVEDLARVRSYVFGSSQGHTRRNALDEIVTSHEALRSALECAREALQTIAGWDADYVSAKKAHAALARIDEMVGSK